MTRLLVASRNPKKLAELRRVLDGAGLSGLTLMSLNDVAPFGEAPETGATFEDNALAKARDAFATTGLASVADDSGLERRGAAFVSACALVSASDEVVVRGEWPGTIAREPRGDGGFGYDPVFIPDGSDRTAAQLSPVEKDAVSHRGRALSLLLPALRALAAHRTTSPVDQGPRGRGQRPLAATVQASDAGHRR